MHNLMARCVFALALAAAAPAAFAYEAAPDAMLGAVAKDVLDRIKDDRNPATLATLVETRILPLFDCNRMARSAMARNWRLASPEQQDTLAAEFRTLLARTFYAALANYRDEVIEFTRLRTGAHEDETIVRSEVKRSNRERMRLDYDLVSTPLGWRICDVKLAGVRLVTTYRDAFAEKVREAGVDGLIKWLANMNRHGDSRFASVKASSWEQSQIVYAILREALQRQ